MTHANETPAAPFRSEAQRVLSRLTQPGSFLAVAPQMENALVMRADEAGEPQRIAVVGRDVAEGLALKEWINAEGEGRVRRYRITPAGRSWLKAQRSPARGGGMEEAAMGFDYESPVGPGRPVVAESPLAILARRKDRNGKPFLAPELVAAGEQLREDFELAQAGERTCQNWDHFLTGRASFGPQVGDLAAAGPAAARARVTSALRDLGPGLGDVVLRCCCYLEGMERAERRMGWSARSGKIVLRIALQRLRRHYDEMVGPHGPLIG
ncbi:DUF6456 domain-containing protein [Pseudoruegeria sp. SHC-113]|uniref:DUF6456 domain-containing protein n=1 Tax=Pseudoruegeria sp. SHC-113 TaxID=2855439 RepID=UPI0028E0A2B2|nr:DUF6456 domain-containing protein [Pseudoruegeria sp. SHC-113]